ncbi:P-loop containing nucleoside triphosphate hydrolase protein [Naematelia encephala]|uniref:RNA helicase n=1 Tax=Naematelia encephala TaxID=71784 RepID=A0A1Y2B3E5_9TREE|nr:P-loop containing nucleoside triphosphate hydrolase protein [Naematelia encephala]
MPSKPSDALLDSELTFSHEPFSTLDPRVLRALADLSFAHPTLVQASAIPLLLEGKDVLAKARTGSGKTAAYAIPAVQRVIEAKSEMSLGEKGFQATRVVVLVPTKELALQVTAFFKKLTVYCDGLVTVCNVAAGGAAIQRVLLDDLPDIIVSTPTPLLANLQNKSIDLSSLSFLAIDEADLLLSYGHKDDLVRIMDPGSGFVPRLGVQGCLMSATLEGVESVKGLVLRNPAILTLSEPTATSLLTQHYTHTSERDKFLLIYVLLKLKLIRGKSIVFVNDIERGYRVKLFLEQFGIKCCVVNSELPLASRYHVVEEFNRGVYDVVVATDEGAGPADEEPEAEEDEVDEEDEPAEENAEEKEQNDQPVAGPSKRKANEQPANLQKRKRAAQSSMARGIDFTSASTVINFDLPPTSTSYMHRVGRTARAGHSGLALSFIVPKDKWGKDRAVSLKSAKDDELVWERIKARSKAEGAGEMKEWDWGGKKGEIEGFRYRMEDALRAVTTKRVSDARREELRRELLNSEKLKAHFAANPLDLAYLRHDAPLHPARQQSHLKHVPNYLMPRIGGIPRPSGDVGDHSNVPFKRSDGGRKRGRGRGGAKGSTRKVDPLKFKV